jgi:hypothetical protein
LEIVRLCPFSVATLVWGERPGAYRLTVGVKATFSLAHRAEARLAPNQDTAHGDVSWDHNPQAALFAPSDFVPFKPRIDILFSGRAFAPNGTPAEVVVPRLRVGHFEKTLRVSGPRVWLDGPAGMRPSAPERFVAAPMRYELAAMQGENMSGIAAGSVGTGWPLPRIETHEESSTLVTPGFGPLPVLWRAEARGATEAAMSFARRLRIEPAVVPHTLDFSLFNSAPRDQQVDSLEAAPVIELENLCRKMPRLETRLPNIRPRAFHVPRGQTKPNEVDLRLDTIWIDGLRMIAVVTWRGSTPLETPSEHALGRIVVAAESPEMMVSLEDVESPPMLQDESSPRPILPRPFEGEISEDEGYTLLPSKPIREESAAPEPEKARPPSGLPPRPRDSSVPIPPSGERLIEDRDSTVFVQASVPGPSEIVERASMGHFSYEPPAAARSVEPEAPETKAWESDEMWPTDRVAVLPNPPPSAIAEAADVTSAASAEVEDPADAAPTTARTGSVPPMSTHGSMPPDAAPPTLAPTTQKTASTPPPATLPTPTPRVTGERAAPEQPAATQRAPGLLTWSEPKGLLPAASADALFSTSGSAASASAPEVISVVRSSAQPAASSAQTSRPTSVTVEPMRSTERRRVSSPGLPAARVSLAELPLELCATLAARIDRCPGERARIIEEMGLSQKTFTAAEQAWAIAIRAETEQGGSELRTAYERAYLCQIELERGGIEVEEYVRLMVAVEHGDADAILAELGLPREALVRIERVYQERMAADPSFGVHVRQEMGATRRAFTRVMSRAKNAQPPAATDPADVRATAYGEAATPSRPRSNDR